MNDNTLEPQNLHSKTCAQTNVMSHITSSKFIIQIFNKTHRPQISGVNRQQLHPMQATPREAATEAVDRSTLIVHKGQPQKLSAAPEPTGYISIDKSIKPSGPGYPKPTAALHPPTCSKAATEAVDRCMLLQKGQPQKL